MLWQGTGSAHCLGRKYQIEQHLFSTLVRSLQLEIFYSEFCHWLSRQKEAFSRTLLGYTVFLQFLSSLWESQHCCCTIGACFRLLFYQTCGGKERKWRRVWWENVLNFCQSQENYEETAIGRNMKLTAAHWELSFTLFPGITASWLRGQQTI